MKTATAEQILHKYFHHFKSERTRDLIVKAMEEYRQQPYASQPMSAGPTVQQLREVAKNNPDTFLAGALYVIDNYKLNSPLMSAEQVEYKVGDKVEIIASIYGHEFELGDIVSIFEFDEDSIGCINEKGKKWWVERSEIKPAPTVKAEGWVSVEDKLPEVLETVWVSNGKGWTALGCRTDYYENDEGGFDWCWAGSNGIIYEESGKIVSECEEDDLDVRFWHPLPSPPPGK